MQKISASIVLYKNEYNQLMAAVNSLFNNYPELTLYLVDNSPTSELSKIAGNPQIVYSHLPSNPGFGAAHNVAINAAIDENKQYHFIVNPDIYFEGDVIMPMVNYMQQNENIGMMMPQVLNEDKTIQNLPKLLPKPSDILWRKFKRPRNAYNKFINNYELRFVSKEVIYNAPVLSGCFTLLNLKAIKEVGVYDDRYFMYFEDWDLSRRMHRTYQTIYFPSVSVYHGYESGANKNGKLFKIFLQSAFAYFNKWGWLFDKERNIVNAAALAQFK
ncbi:glycosyltransferase [Pedobacter fastidiosus]|uniref:Glycosyltransferase family 2 protein n=1 Tax=Pedobacter fastidiosus TaxID=2765361 RepID=A0ABR7KS05_9SPHI|nr:glycosyltransferase family 2 protein [Pedobacter fastidiosus]MBC6110542.1 glycosyltransferase family 2 protein [Pedobacter fastidiosus]